MKPTSLIGWPRDDRPWQVLRKRPLLVVGIPAAAHRTLELGSMHLHIPSQTVLADGMAGTHHTRVSDLLRMGGAEAANPGGVYAWMVGDLPCRLAKLFQAYRAGGGIV